MKKTHADAFDSLINWVAVSLLLMSINLMLEASTFLLESPLREQIDAIARVPQLAALIVVAVIVFRTIAHGGGPDGHNYFRYYYGRLSDSYSFEMVKRAAAITFYINLLAVPFIDIATNETELPADFYIKLPAIMLTAGFSLIYFYLIWQDRDDDSAEDAFA